MTTKNGMPLYIRCFETITDSRDRFSVIKTEIGYYVGHIGIIRQGSDIQPVCLVERTTCYATKEEAIAVADKMLESKIRDMNRWGS